MQAHREPEIWNNPEEFNPERFLTKKEDGSLGLKANSTANLFSWGAGKRKCLGYDLSRQQLFIFICTIIRRLDVKPFQVGVEPTLPWPSNFGLALKPKLFRIRVTERADNWFAWNRQACACFTTWDFFAFTIKSVSVLTCTEYQTVQGTTKAAKCVLFELK